MEQSQEESSRIWGSTNAITSALSDDLQKLRGALDTHARTAEELQASANDNHKRIQLLFDSNSIITLRLDGIQGYVSNEAPKNSDSETPTQKSTEGFSPRQAQTSWGSPAAMSSCIAAAPNVQRRAGSASTEALRTPTLQNAASVSSLATQPRPCQHGLSHQTLRGCSPEGPLQQVMGNATFTEVTYSQGPRPSRPGPARARSSSPAAELEIPSLYVNRPGPMRQKQQSGDVVRSLPQESMPQSSAPQLDSSLKHPVESKVLRDPEKVSKQKYGADLARQQSTPRHGAHTLVSNISPRLGPLTSSTRAGTSMTVPQPVFVNEKRSKLEPEAPQTFKETPIITRRALPWCSEA